jgi:hypothetical protein
MCTYLSCTTQLNGTARGIEDDQWFPIGSAVVAFDHPQDALLDHALCLDLRGRANERVAVEIDAESARRLAEAILSVLDSDEAKAVRS